MYSHSSPPTPPFPLGVNVQSFQLSCIGCFTFPSPLYLFLLYLGEELNGAGNVSFKSPQLAETDAPLVFFQSNQLMMAFKCCTFFPHLLFYRMFHPCLSLHWDKCRNEASAARGRKDAIGSSASAASSTPIADFASLLTAGVICTPCPAPTLLPLCQHTIRTPPSREKQSEAAPIHWSGCEGRGGGLFGSKEGKR